MNKWGKRKIHDGLQNQAQEPKHFLCLRPWKVPSPQQTSRTTMRCRTTVRYCTSRKQALEGQVAFDFFRKEPTPNLGFGTRSARLKRGVKKRTHT